VSRMRASMGTLTGGSRICSLCTRSRSPGVKPISSGFDPHRQLSEEFLCDFGDDPHVQAFMVRLEGFFCRLRKALAERSAAYANMGQAGIHMGWRTLANTTTAS